MGAVVADHLLARLGVELHRDGVAHGAGGNEKRGFLAKDFGGASLQAIDGGIFAVNIVADRGCRHGSAHGFGGLSDGIASEIDQAATPKNSWNISLDTMTPRLVRRTRVPDCSS